MKSDPSTNGGVVVDRREAIKAAAGMGAIGAFTDILKAEEIEVQTIPEKTAENAVLILLRHPGRLSEISRHQVYELWNKLVKNTVLESVRLAILGEGMTLEVVTMPPARRTKWRIVDAMIEEHGDGEE